MHALKRRTLLRPAQVFTLCFLCLRMVCAAPHLFPARFVSSPAVPRYQTLELAFDVQTDATNIFLPYDPHLPAYAANLKPDEDARDGVSVDALLLPPGVTDWAKARTHPAFSYQSFAPAEPVPPHHPTDLLLISGRPDWRVRFAPDHVGVWHYKLRVADKTGTVVGPVGVFSCTASDSVGFVRVSPTDPRYLVRDGNASCNFVGDNFQVRDDIYHVWARFAAEHSEDGAQTLIRLWIGARNGLEVFGGFANSDGGRTWNFHTELSHPCELRGDAARSGRFSVLVPTGSDLGTAVPVRPGVPYTVSAWVKSAGAGPASVRISARPEGASETGADFLVPSQWTRISYTPPAVRSGSATFLNLTFHAQRAVLIDDVAVTAPDGFDALGVGDFERHVRPNLRQAWLLDNVVQVAARARQSLRLTCFDNDDRVYCAVGSDGRPAPHDDANFYGRTNDASADLPVRRWQRYAVRYLMARYGASTAVAQWEFCNEGPSYNGNHYAAAEAFGRAVHTFTAHGRRLASTSFYQNSAAPSYVPEFYENALYPDVDWADVHFYPSPNPHFGGFLPFNSGVDFYGVRGFHVDPRGGPNGWGRVWATAQSILPGKGGDPNFGAQQFPCFRVRGKGVWHLSGWFRHSPNARFVGTGPVLKFHVPGVQGRGIDCAVSPPSQSEQWTRGSATFALPDDSDHLGATLRYEATGLAAGGVEFSGLRLTGPDGRDRVRILFDEPTMDTDTASLVQFLPLECTGLSGDTGIGKPFSVGETDYLDNNTYDPDLARDVQGVWLRHWTWAHLNPSGAVVFWWYSPTLHKAGEHGWWRYAAGYQRFLRDVPLANGRYRAIDALCADARMQIIGQADLIGARAHFFVYNRELNWHAQAVEGKRPVPQTVTIAVRGLPDGLYRVQTWDTARGVPVVVQSLRARNKTISVPVRLGAGEAAIKIDPVHL